MNDNILQQYYQILCPEFPAFLNDYLKVDILQRLKYIGLFCGLDYTSLFKLKRFYSRYDHSLGVALIIWNFTHDKKQTIAGLLHDVSSPVFSHVVDFLHHDYLEQEVTEAKNTEILKNSKELYTLLQRDHIAFEAICDYKQYPIADNPKPALSADRLEYMFSTGWVMLHLSFKEIEEIYNDIILCQNDKNILELGFNHLEQALAFTKNMNEVNHIYLSNEDKFAMQFLADILKKLYDDRLITIDTLYTSKEEDILTRIQNSKYQPLLEVYRQLNKINRSDIPLADYYCISIDVKRRYIDPLVQNKRLSALSKKAATWIEDIKTYQDSRYAYIDLYDFRKT